MKKRDWQLLFSSTPLQEVLDAKSRAVGEQVRAIPKEQFASETDEMVSARVASTMVVSPLEILDTPDKISTSDRETKIDVRHDFDRAVRDRSKPAYVDGVEVTYHVPFVGDRTLFEYLPSPRTLNPPRAVISGSELRFPYDVANDAAAGIAGTKQLFDADLAAVRQWLAWVNKQVGTYNEALEPSVRRHVELRRAQLKKSSDDLAGLGFPRRESAAERPKLSAAERASRRRTTHRKFDVALSFAGEERPYVAKVADELKRIGIEVFYDKFEQVDLWGKDLVTHFDEVYGSRGAKFVVIFASRLYVEKAWTNTERRMALGRLIEGNPNSILPVRLDDTAVPGIPTTIGYFDGRAVPPEKIAELIRQKLDLDNGDEG